MQLRTWARLITFLAAAAITAIIFTSPQVFGMEVTGRQQGMLIVLMLGVSVGFIYGIGFQPRKLLWRMIFNPWIAWGLMLFGGSYFLPGIY